MNSTIYIPKKLHVGFQNRSDTYTGKLAYVIYEDEKGKLRKEASWKSWKDDKIETHVLDNVPMEGFVLNKKAGGYSTGWNHRQTYCRVYHPSGFEFEITINNLLYILDNCSMIKGKGIEGKLILGWEGKDLILVPVDSPDYKLIEDYSKKLEGQKTSKLTNKNLIVNKIYIDKAKKEYLYLGRFLRYNEKAESEMLYWFLNETSICRFKTINGKFIEIKDNESIDYADVMDWIETTQEYSPINPLKEEYTRVNICEEIKSPSWRDNREFYTADRKRLRIYDYYWQKQPLQIYHGYYETNRYGRQEYNTSNPFGKGTFTYEEAENLEIYEKFSYLKNGKRKTTKWRYEANEQ